MKKQKSLYSVIVPLFIILIGLILIAAYNPDEDDEKNITNNTNSSVEKSEKAKQETASSSSSYVMKSGNSTTTNEIEENIIENTSKKNEIEFEEEYKEVEKTSLIDEDVPEGAEYVIFCLDYSGSMYDNGIDELVYSMENILDNNSDIEEEIKFLEYDKITVYPFSTAVLDRWIGYSGTDTEELIENIKSLNPYGSTNIYDTLIEALKLVEENDLSSKYNVSIILFTDGESNVGSYSEFAEYYENMQNEVTIYSILYGEANSNELQSISALTGGEVFDGREDLLEAFKEVRKQENE